MDPFRDQSRLQVDLEPGSSSDAGNGRIRPAHRYGSNIYRCAGDSTEAAYQKSLAGPVIDRAASDLVLETVTPASIDVVV